MKPIMCKNCNKLLFYAHVFVGEIKCKCGHKAEYRMLTESFIQAVRNGDIDTDTTILHAKAIATT